MTQTIEEKARELLAVQLDIGLYHDDAERIRTAQDGLGVICAASAIAALTEALTRIEELEVIADFVITIGNIIQRSKISDEGPHSLRQSDGTVITGEAADMFGELADSVIAIARRAALTKGIKG